MVGKIIFAACLQLPKLLVIMQNIRMYDIWQSAESGLNARQIQLLYNKLMVNKIIYDAYSQLCNYRQQLAAQSNPLYCMLCKKEGNRRRIWSSTKHNISELWYFFFWISSLFPDHIIGPSQPDYCEESHTCQALLRADLSSHMKIWDEGSRPIPHNYDGGGTRHTKG